MTAGDHAGAEAVAVRLSGCPLCGTTGLAPCPPPLAWIGEEVFGPHRGAFGVSRCRSCSFQFVNPRPSSALLGRFYGGTGYACHDPRSTDTDDARARHLLAFVAARATGRRLLDYGCGAGVLLRVARAEGWSARGFDPGGAALDACRSQGLEATSDLASLPRGGFDAIVLGHVLEHVTDLAGTLSAIRPLLAPGGRLLVECPNVGSLRARLSHPALTRHARFDERYRAFPIHLSYFTPRTLSRLLSANGLEVLERATWGFGIEELVLPAPGPPRRPEGGGTTPGRPRAAPPLARRLAKAALRRLLLDTGLGENVVMVARAAPRAG